MGQRVAILGASNNPDRYSYRAFRMLQEYGHTPVPVTPKFFALEGVPAVAKISEINGPVDTLTMYVNPAVSGKMADDIVTLRPKRVIFNPGSENPGLAKVLKAASIEVVEACTLVMLRTQQF